MLSTAASFSKRAQEIEYRLCLRLRELIEVVDHLVCFRSGALVFFDGIHKIPRAAVVQEKDALAEPPKGGSAEFVAAGETLTHVVRQIRPHVVHEKVRKGVYRDVVLSGRPKLAAF